MRVLLVHNRYRTLGGEERHLDLLEDSLRRADIDVARFEVASPDGAGRFEHLRLGFALTYRPAGARLLRRALAQHKPDIVHFHNLFPLLTPSVVHEAHHYGAGVVLTIHNYRFACPAGTLLRNGSIHEDCVEGSSLLCGLRNSRGVWTESIAYGIALEIQRRLRMLHRWVDAYVTPSQFLATMLARARYPEERIHVIHHGVPISDAPSSGGRYALYAGRLSFEKGTQTLITASRLAPDVPMVVAGNGPLEGIVANAASGENFSYLGKVDQTKVAELMRGARFTVMPSECYEGQPYGALESMAVGTPLIASRLGGLAEIVEDGVTGVLVPPSDPAALASTMRAVWADESQEAPMGTRAWLYAREQFGLERQIQQLVALYDTSTR